MLEDLAHLGTDLRLLSNLGEQATRDRGRDLVTVASGRVARPRDRDGGGDRHREEVFDLARLEGIENLKQALLLRCLTARGELAPLGHRDYGSRLAGLIGEPDSELTRHPPNAEAFE